MTPPAASPLTDSRVWLSVRGLMRGMGFRRTHDVFINKNKTKKKILININSTVPDRPPSQTGNRLKNQAYVDYLFKEIPTSLLITSTLTRAPFTVFTILIPKRLQVVFAAGLSVLFAEVGL